MDLFQKCFDFDEDKRVKEAGLYPYFRTITSQQDPVVTMQGRNMVMLGSNNYLGLTSHPKVKEAAKKAIDRYGAGCAGSRFLNGTLDIHEELEEKLAAFMKREACLVFSTGFQANLGTISSLVGREDTIYADKMNHASIIDGCRLSFGSTKKFGHNDLESLENLLKMKDKGGRFIIVDGVFSMEGDIAPVDRLADLASRYGARLMVDDAHGVGVLGKTGRGTCQHFGVLQEVDIILGTFSKSLATVGGFIVGDHDVINWVKHFARPLIFSASPPPSTVASVLAALEVIDSEPELLEKLWINTRYMIQEFKNLGYNVGWTETPIVPIVVGEDETAFVVARKLQDHGVFVNPVISPATPPGRALIRTSYMATHQREHLDQALQAFKEVGKILQLIP